MTEIKLTTNRKIGVSRKRHSVHGPPGSGKSFAAASLDPKFKLNNKRWVKLDNTIWVPLDEGACSGLLEHKMEVAEVPVQTIWQEHGVVDGCDVILDFLYDNVKPSTNVVIDTLTSLDQEIMDHYDSDEHCPRTTSGKRDSFALQRRVVALHNLFKRGLFGLNCNLVVLMHSKPLTDNSDTDKKTRAQAPQGEHSPFAPDFYYHAARNIYRRHCDVIQVANVRKIKVQGKPPKKQYVLLSDSMESDGFETKNRFQKYIKPVETRTLYEIYSDIEKQLK